MEMKDYDSTSADVNVFPTAKDIVITQHEEENKMKLEFMMKIEKARKLFDESHVQKSGTNTYRGNSYYKLDDIICHARGIFRECGIMVWYDFRDMWRMRVIDMTTGYEEEINLPKPMIPTGKDFLQNVGKSQTYLRKYLYMQLLDMAEVDVEDRDAGAGTKIKPKKNHTPKDPYEGKKEQTKLEEHRSFKELKQEVEENLKNLYGEEVSNAGVFKHLQTLYRNKEITVQEFNQLKKELIQKVG